MKIHNRIKIILIGICIIALPTQAIAQEVHSLNMNSVNSISSDDFDYGDPDTNFNWVEKESYAVGNITVSDNNINFKGNPSNAGTTLVYADNVKAGNQKFNFSYTLDFGDNIGSAGVLVKFDGDEGYYISMGRYQALDPSVPHLSSGLYKIDNVHRTAGTTNLPNAQLIRLINLPYTGTLTIESKENEIIINGESIPVSESPGNYFGFLSLHYRHGCPSIGNFDLFNITMWAPLDDWDVTFKDGKRAEYSRTINSKYQFPTPRQVDGYGSTGWYHNNGTQHTSFETTRKNYILTARYTPNKYTITYRY